MVTNQENPFDKPLKKDQTSISASKTLAIPKEKLDFTRADPRTWQNGEVIEGLYEVRDMTAGGMGVVYFVNHKKWNTMLAVKSPNLKMIGDEKNIRRFIREAEAWVDLGKHPNIASCFYVRIIKGIPRIFVEYVDGGSLKEWIGKGQPEKLEDILDIAIQISDGMAHAHDQKNLIHRDLKPANVLMTKDGTVKITDFGLVRRSGEVEMSGGEKPVFVQDSIWKTMTVTGTRVGTPAYMPPEQWSAAHEAGREADIYSFGIMLYEMLCGRRPFELTEQEREMHPMAQAALFEQKHREEKVPAITREVPANLSRLVIRCLEKSPDNRYHSFEELRDQLKSIYWEVGGREYPRKIASEVELKADDLNNRALSLIDLKQEGEAVKCWEEALRLNPHHMESVFNYGYWQWHNAIITDEQYLDRITDLELSEGSNPTYWHSFGLIHLEREDLVESLHAIKKALELGLRDADVLNAMGSVYLGLEDFKNAKKAFMEAVTAQGSWQSRLYLAEALFKIGDEQAYREEIDILLDSPKYKNALEILGITDENTAVQCVRNSKMGRIGLIKILTGHTDPVMPIIAVTFSPDGKYALTCGSDKTARLWDLKTGKNITTLTGHKEYVVAVAFSLDGKCAWTGSNDHTFRYWDLKTGRIIREHIGYFERRLFGFSLDGRYALTGSYDHKIACAWLWDITRGKKIKKLTGHTTPVHSVAFSLDSRYILTGNGDKTARLWDLKTGKNIRTLAGHTATVNSVAFSPDGKYALTGSRDNTARLWDLKTGENIRTLAGHTATVNSVAFSPDGRYALTGSWDKTARLWDLKTGKNIRTLTGHTAPVDSVAFSPDGKYALTGSRDNTARLWEIINIPKNYFVFILCKPIDVQQSSLEENRATELINKVNTLIKMNLFSEAYNVLRQIQTCRGFERSPKILDLISFCAKKGKRIKLNDAWQKRIMAGHLDQVVSVTFSSDGRYALTGSNDKTARMWDIKTGENIKKVTLKGQTDYVNSMVFSPDGRYALTGSDDIDGYTAQLWDVTTGENIRTLIGHSNRVVSVAFSPDGRYVLTGSYDGTARLWDVETGENVGTLRHYGYGNSVAFSPDGRYALTGYSDYTISSAQLWNMKNSENIKIFTAKARIHHVHGSIHVVALSPDSRYALFGDWDKTVRLWDIETGENIRTLVGHTDPVYSVAFSPDGKYVLTGSKDKTARLWDMKTGESIKILTGHLDQVDSVAFSPNGRYVLTGSHDKTVRLWELDWELEFPEDKNAKHLGKEKKGRSEIETHSKNRT